jgi:flavin-dependent dehydrogenase
LSLEDGATLAAACVIDATGRRASIAKRSGARRTRDDGLIALYAWARGADAEDERTLVESVPDGWWYTAPLPARERVVVLHVDGSEAHRARREFRERLAATKHVRAVVEPEGLSRPHAVEACGARLDAFVGRGWVAVGDAALSFDPIAAQGIFNALYTGMKAGEAVDAALRGDPSGLSAYARRLEEIRAAYVERRVHVYELEPRFASSPFWARRQA